MGLDDFDMVSKNVEENVKSNDKNIDIEYKSIEYYLFHLDELLECVKNCYCEYTQTKMKYEFRKNKYQTSINWTDENGLRVSQGLPKITTQDQRNSVINLKLKNLNEKLTSSEVEYKFYSKIFNFISNNFELLYDLYENDDENEKND